MVRGSNPRWRTSVQFVKRGSFSTLIYALFFYCGESPYAEGRSSSYLKRKPLRRGNVCWSNSHREAPGTTLSAIVNLATMPAVRAGFFFAERDKLLTARIYPE